MAFANSGLLAGTAACFLLSVSAANAGNIGRWDASQTILLAQIESGSGTVAEPAVEQDPIKIAEQAVEDARTALREAMATGGDVRGARRDLQTAIRQLNETRDGKVADTDAETDGGGEAKVMPSDKEPAGKEPATSPTIVLPQTPPAQLPTLATPEVAPTTSAPENPQGLAPPHKLPETPQLALPKPPPATLPVPQVPPPTVALPEVQAESAGQAPPALSPPSPSSSEQPAADAASVEPPSVESEADGGAEQPGFFKRLFGGGGGQSKPEEEIAAPAETQKQAGKSRKPSLPIFEELPPIEGPKVVTIAPDARDVVKQEDESRVVVRDRGQLTIKHDDNDRFRRKGEDIKVEKAKDGGTITTVTRDNGIQIVTVRDSGGDIVQRYRKKKDGEIEILIGQRDRDGRPRQERQDNKPAPGPDRRFDFTKILPKLVVPIPQQEYIVGSQGASRSQIERALIAPPVEAIERPYSLEEIRRSDRLRSKLRRIDVDTVNFEFGAATIAEDQVPSLQAIGNALASIIANDPSEVFMIEGHTDAVGSDLANLTLSDRRAESIAEILAFYFNIPPENLITQGYGEQYLKVLTAGPERVNRRASVRRITPLLVGQL